MTYQEFKNEYSNLFKAMMAYSPNECGSTVYAEKMATLSDKYKEFSEAFDNECDAMYG